MGQIRALKLQLENNYGTHLTSKHPIMPWLIKHAAYPLDRYVVHADGNTSYYRRWNKEHKTPICEFGETVLYMLLTAKHRPKMEARFFQAIWPGKDTSTNENILGISRQVVKARTIRRQTKPEKYNKQMMDIINSTPMTNYDNTNTDELRRVTSKTSSQQQTGDIHSTDTDTASTGITNSEREQTHIRTDNHRRTNGNVTNILQQTNTTANPNNSKTGCGRRHSRRQFNKTTTDESTTDSSTETGNNTRTRQNPTPSVGGYCHNKTWRQGQSSLQRRPTRSRHREDPSRTMGHQHRRFEPRADNRRNEARDPVNESTTSVHLYNTLTQEQRSKIIKSRWVLRQKGNTRRARIVAKGYAEDVKDNDDIYASTPIFCVLRLLLPMSLSNRWIVRAGDISTAFLHAKGATDDLLMFPPTEFYNPEDQVVWKLNKAIYGLRSSPSAKHLAETLQQLGMSRLASEPNVFKTTEATHSSYAMWTTSYSWESQQQ